MVLRAAAIRSSSGDELVIELDEHFTSGHDHMLEHMVSPQARFRVGSVPCAPGAQVGISERVIGAGQNQSILSSMKPPKRDSKRLTKSCMCSRIRASPGSDRRSSGFRRGHVPRGSGSEPR